jgi:hypothetical protein
MSDQSATTKIDEGVRRHADKLLALSAVVLILVGTIVYSVVEDWSWVDSLYFSVVAITTVGFGDLTPSTDGSKLFTVFYVLSGISIISLWLSERLRRHGLTAAQRRRSEN